MIVNKNGTKEKILTKLEILFIKSIERKIMNLKMRKAKKKVLESKGKTSMEANLHNKMRIK